MNVQAQMSMDNKELGAASGVLNLTTIDGAFDAVRDIAAAPLCFIGRENAFPNWQELQFAEPFPDEAALEAAAEHISGLADYLLPELTQRLNAHHGTSYSTDFWRLIVLPWLLELIQRTWTSFARLSVIADQAGEKQITVKVFEGDAEWRFEDTAGFFDTMLKDYRFNWWIDSEIAAVLATDNWQLLPTEPVQHPVIEEASAPPKKQSAGIVRRTLRTIKYRLGYSDILGIRWAGLLLSIYVNLLPKNPSKMRSTFDPDFHPESYFPGGYLDVLNRLIDATMPDSFLSGFPDLAAKARRLPYVPGRLRLGVLSFWNEREKVIAAFATEAGEKRVVFQHGVE